MPVILIVFVSECISFMIFWNSFVKRIAGMSITAIRIDMATSNNDGVMNIGIWLDDEVFVVCYSTCLRDFLQVLWYNTLMDLSILQQFGTAIALSVLLGLEREQHKKVHKNASFAGVRTFSLIGLLGALAFYLMNTSVLLFALIAGTTFAFIIASYVVTALKLGRIGVTTEIAAVITFLIGGLCVSEKYVFAVALALLTLAILYFKTPLHLWAKNIKGTEFIATIKFMIIAFVILPLLPNVGYGPYEIFNPYIIWLMVVFVSGISFASYILIRVLGPKKGIGLTGFLAGLISSTALAMSFSKESRENKSVVNPYVFAVVVASTAMFFRVLLEVAVLNRELLSSLILPVFSMAVFGIAGALFLILKKEKGAKEAEGRVSGNAYKLKNPFRLLPALKFGFFFALILLIAKFGQIYLGDKGLYLVSLVSGLVDVDAITVSVSRLPVTDASAFALMLAMISNTFFKGLIFLIFGSRKAAIKILAVFGLMVASGLTTLTLL